MKKLNFRVQFLGDFGAKCMIFAMFEWGVCADLIGKFFLLNLGPKSCAIVVIGGGKVGKTKSFLSIYMKCFNVDIYC